MEEKSSKKRLRDDDKLVPDSSDLPEVKKIRDDLLDFFDESDSHRTSQDLDSVMKSFQEEISASSSSIVVVDLTSDSGESQPDLGYLLEASDDELGLPPSSVNSSGDEAKNDVSELVRVDSGDSAGHGDSIWGFDEQIPGYDSFGMGSVENFNPPGCLTFDDGLFEYSDACFDFSDYS